MGGEKSPEKQYYELTFLLMASSFVFTGSLDMWSLIFCKKKTKHIVAIRSLGSQKHLGSCALVNIVIGPPLMELVFYGAKQ